MRGERRVTEEVVWIIFIAGEERRESLTDCGGGSHSQFGLVKITHGMMATMAFIISLFIVT